MARASCGASLLNTSERNIHWYIPKWVLWSQTQASKVLISDNIQQCSVACNYIPMPQNAHYSDVTTASWSFVRGIHGFPSQRASNAKNVSMSWRHHGSNGSEAILTVMGRSMTYFRDWYHNYNKTTHDEMHKRSNDNVTRTIRIAINIQHLLHTIDRETKTCWCRLDSKLVHNNAPSVYFFFQEYIASNLGTSVSIVNPQRKPHLRCTFTGLQELFNTLRQRQYNRHFANDIFKCIVLNENFWISIQI